MSNFNLENYETVKERKKRFYKDYPDGRIICNVEHCDLDYALIKTGIFKNKIEQADGLIFATGNALELHDKQKQLSKYGKEYESVNYSSWLENAEESSIGRALDNAGYLGNNKCSRAEIEKAQNNTKVQSIETAKDKVKELYKTIKSPSEKQKEWIAQIDIHSLAEINAVINKLKKGAINESNGN